MKRHKIKEQNNSAKLKLNFTKQLFTCTSYDDLHFDWNNGFNTNEKDSNKLNQVRKNVFDIIEEAKRNYILINKIPKPIDRPLLPHYNNSHVLLRKYAQETSPHILPRDWRKKLAKFLPLKLIGKFTELSDELYKNIDQHYAETNLLIATNSKILPLFDEYDILYDRVKVNFTSPGRTENYDKFIRKRKQLKKNLFIVHPVFRDIQRRALTESTKPLMDFSIYKGPLKRQLSILSEEIEENLLTAKNRIIKPFFDILLKEVRTKLTGDDLSRSSDLNCIKYIKALGSIINLCALEIFKNTIDNLLFVLSDPEFVPFIRFKLCCETTLELSPSLQEIDQFYQSILNNIFSYSDNRIFAINKSENLLDGIIIPDFLIENAQKEIYQKIRIVFHEVFDHMKNIESVHAALFNDSLQQTMDNYFQENHSFDEICEKIDYFNNYKNIILSMDHIVYFRVGIIDQSETIQSFNMKIDKYMMQISEKMLFESNQINCTISEKFEYIATKALKIPKTAAQLTELGKYMLWVKTDFIKELEAQLRLALNYIIHLIEITTLDKETFRSNVKTLSWLNKIQPILDAYNSMFEQRKAELEDDVKFVVEQLEQDVHSFTPRLALLDDMSDDKNSYSYCETLRSMTVQIQTFEKTLTWANEQETLLQLAQTAFPELYEYKNIIYPFYDLVFLCACWHRHYSVWMDGPWENIYIEDVEQKLDDYYKKIQNYQKSFRTKIKQQIVNKYRLRFKGSIEDKDIDKQPAPLQLTAGMLINLKNFKPFMQIITIMRNPALLQRHWDEMSHVVGQDMTPNAGTTLRKIFNKNIIELLDELDIISNSATKELALKNLLAKMKEEWTHVNFQTSLYKDSGLSILSGLDDIQAILDDHITKTLSMRGSAFVKPIEAEVKEWYAQIMRLNASLDAWSKVQIQWCYLMPIFSSKDIVKQMPEEGVLYKEIDTIFKRYMVQVSRDPRALIIGTAPGILETFTECLTMLDKINDGVVAYLEKKRLYFPRFFFLSNDEMLEILSETKDPLRVQPHLRKCFEGISKLYFDKKLVIYSMYSQEGENVSFLETIDTVETRGAVEKWLVQVETQMLKAVRNEIFLAKQDYEQKPRTLWIEKWEGQIVLCVSQIFWAKEAEYCLRARSVPEMVHFYTNLMEQLNDTVRLIQSPDISNLNRITIKALIVIDVHAKDVIQYLVEQKIDSVTDFQWLSQLRYYWQDDVLVRLINATVYYAYEYLGNSDRLVITPLTDRCYRTLIGAYQLHLNGAPEGPAGTGKTETTKDLAKAIAVQCIVFNCSEGLDYKAMGKFFKGLASSGAWACFDEFNRIELEVLSVIAQQILCIILAVRAHFEEFIFEGTLIKLKKPPCYVCITMNPGYAGRSELPDNLKILFRTVAMMVPDYALIGEISLYSFGFVDARKLSVKIVQTYRLCSEQLSSQNHYDYGMRAVKTVLQASGNNKIAYPDDSEDILVLRAIKDVNLPKFLSCDVSLFEGIISDLFPDVDLPAPEYTDLLNSIKYICAETHIQPVDDFIVKIIQTYEMMIVRHGFMLVGLPFSGKSTCLQVLSSSLTDMHKKGLNQAQVEYQTVNPKSVTMGQLYGRFDPVSYEWSDGIIATCFRNFATDPSSNRKWIIFDGPIDATWIENMNTVLDDNKKLCLMSGEVIAMSNAMSMIFEVMDLAQASPATVSRCGMIYFEPNNVGWRAIALSWIQTCNPIWVDNNQEYIMNWLDFFIPLVLDYVQRNCIFLCFAGEMNLVKSTLNIIEMLMNRATGKRPDDSKHFNGWFQASLIIGIGWGIGGALDLQSRNKFDNFHRSLWTEKNEDIKLPNDLDITITCPGDGMYTDYYYNYKLKGSWKYWPDEVKTMPIQESKSLQQTLVPTLDVARNMFFLKLHIEAHRKLLLIGETGTGKTFYTQNMMMKKLPMDLYEPSFITFTVQITANQTQDLVISKLCKLKRGKYGPTKGKYAVIFVDDINLPAKEIYGAQPPIELLRQYFDYGHWYDLKDTTKLFLYNIMFLAAMGPVGGSRQEIYQRFLRHFNIYSINSFSDDSMNKIFTKTLMKGLQNNGFATDVIMMVMYIVNATLSVYTQAIEYLRPTPAKSHYIFNLRDFARVIQGCALMKKESVGDDKSIFVRLWIHEVLRVFYDRLVAENDREWLFDKIKDVVKDCFKVSFENVFEESNLPKFEGKFTKESMSDFIFGVYNDLDTSPEQRRYEEMSNIEDFLNIAEQYLQEYNDSHKTRMNIVLFRYALEHLSRVCRIISMPCGSGLLVGIGGSGRQSNARLAATICGFTTFQPEITKNYDVNAWRDDIKSILKQSGGLGNDLVFLFNEGQITDEIFLQDIDGLLNSGEVPNIYAIDEKQEILELTRLAAQGGNRNLDISALEIFSFFTNRCKEKLHIILCFSPVGPALRTRLRLYPALINCCTIDWFESWPADALEKVAEKYMEDVNIEAQIKKLVFIACKHFHVGAENISDYFYKTFGRKTYITSASYLDLIRCFSELYNAKQKEIQINRNQYIVGLEQLAFAAEQITTMQKDLNELKPKLVEVANKCTQMAKQIEQETIEIEKTSVLVKKDEENANIQAEAAQKLKEECEADLAIALPALEEANAALNTLKPADITLVKAMKNPPDTVKLVMAAVCVMKGVPPDKIPDLATGRRILDYWGPSKRILGDINFLQSLKDYDKDNIPPAIMQKIRNEFITKPQFKPHIVAKASTAAEGLCKWIIAMDVYDKIIKVVAPKKEKLALAEAQFNETMEVLMAKQTLLKNLQEKLSILNQQLEEANAEMKKTQDSVKLCTEKLYRAEKLIKGLGGEKVRWVTAAELLLQNYQSLVGDILLSCGVIAYLAPFNLMVRNETLTKWHEYIQHNGIPCSETYSLKAILGSDIKIQTWQMYGLPNDNFSIDNAIIMDMSKRCSLLIDPQGQANYWIRTMEKKNKLVSTKFIDPTYMKQLEHCIEFGQPVLIENILETLEAPINPILERKTYIQHGAEFISLGDTVIEMNPKFKLYMTTSLRNPHYLPEIFNKVTIINFSLTIEGLEDQLLNIVVAKERPDLQEKREQLIIESAKNKKKLKEVEVLILKILSETEGNILEDQTAIDILDSSKILSEDIQRKQKVSVETENKIEIFRTSYKPVAKHSSILYYCISDLPNIDPMYQYSLKWFINLYISSIANASKSNDLEKRLKFLIATFNYDLYLNVCRSLFEKDKLLFSFILYSKIMLAKDKIDNQLLMWFLTGGTGFETDLTNPAPEWLSKLIWNQIVQLSHFKGFEGFNESFAMDIDKWRYIYDLGEPQEESLPEPWDKKLTLFQKLVVIRVIRPDKILMAITKTIILELGKKFVQPPPFDIAKSYAESNYQFPLIFILSPGMDPMATLQNFADKMGFTNKFKSISLGQGQGPIAEQLIADAQVDEHWVCLQNCHLSVTWMPRLEKICERFDNTNTRPGFRLWLTSYPSDKFPIPVLQNSVKMTNEPPQGLTQNILRTYRSEPVRNPEFYSGCPDKDLIFHKLLYGMVLFHAVVQERRTFGPIGWNISYEFNESDFNISVQQLQIFINEYEQIPFVAILYLVGECNYGGRVTDDWDRRCLNTILIDFINQQVITDSKYKFIDLPSPVYGIPKKTEYADLITFIQQMPMTHPPEVVGLHMNAGIRRDLQKSMTLLNSCLLVQGNSVSGINEDQDKLLSQIVEGILQKLPAPFDLEFASRKYPTVYTESMNTVLCQELERFNILLTEISTSLLTIQKALLGLVVISPSLEMICKSLLIGKIPESWSKVSYPCLKSLSEYINDFCERITFLESWLNQEIPKSFWLSGFFFTQAFLTGVKQNYARKYKIAIDKLTFDFFLLNTTSEKEQHLDDGVHCYGMFLEGARWNPLGYLDEQHPKILYEQLPSIWILPVELKDFSDRGRYTSPLYKTSERKGILSTTGHSTNYVLPILLETKKPISHWIKRSTALLLQLD